MKHKLIKLAKVVRSKNSGPFELTLDVMFKTRHDFELFKRKRFINKKIIAALYKTKPQDILDIIYFEPSNAVKITMKRWIPSGAPGESDIYGSQQHAPLLGLEFEE